MTIYLRGTVLFIIRYYIIRFIYLKYFEISLVLQRDTIVVIISMKLEINLEMCIEITKYLL